MGRSHSFTERMPNFFQVNTVNCLTRRGLKIAVVARVGILERNRRQLSGDPY